jgi:NAD(P)-dependent dehydrogenase (short-subunit alcohol dehydrogenase family)
VSKLAGKVALITGGSSGIGLASAKRFVAEGAAVFISGRRRTQLDTAVREIGGGAMALQADPMSGFARRISFDKTE